MKHLIFDFETLGQDVFRCPVLMMTALTFDDDRFNKSPYTPNELKGDAVLYKFDVMEQIRDFGYITEQGVVDWWKSQPKQLQDDIVLPDPARDIKLKEFFDEFIMYLDHHGPYDYWWTRSNTFDPPILFRMAKDVGRDDDLRTRLKYWAVRDTRTFIDAITGFTLKKNDFIPIDDKEEWNKVFIKHDPVCDIMADVMRLQTLTQN